MTPEHPKSGVANPHATQHLVIAAAMTAVLFSVVLAGAPACARAQVPLDRRGAGERIAFETLGSGIGVLGGVLVGVLAGVATSSEGSPGTFDFTFDLGYLIGVHVAIGAALILAPVLGQRGARGTGDGRVSWLYGLLGSAVLGGGAYAIALAAGEYWYEPSAWVLAPLLGVLVGSVLGLELGAAIDGDPAAGETSEGDDAGGRSVSARAAPLAAVRPGGLVLGVAGAF